MRSLTFILLFVVCLAACSNYGKKVKSGNIEVYYKDGIDAKDAEKTAGLFNTAIEDAGGSTGRKSFQLSKHGDTIQLKMVADKEKLASLDNDDMLYGIINLVADSVYSGQPVNLVLTDRRFKGFRTVTYVKKASLEEQFGTKYVSGNVEVYSKERDSEPAQDLAGLLDRMVKPQTTSSYQLSRAADGLYTIRMVFKKEMSDNVSEEELHTMCQKISDEVFEGAPLVFQLTDSFFKPYRTYNYRME